MGKVIDSMILNGEVELCLKEAIRQENLEFEWIFGEPGNNELTKELFISLKHYLDGSLEYSTLNESNSLDMRCEFRKGPKSIMSNIRATLEGVQQIKQYCLQDNFDDLNPTFMRKTRYQDPKNKSINYGSSASGLYPCRANLKQEIMKDQNSDEVRIFLNNWSSKNKFFRYKKRYSYVTMNKMWRIDLTAVKSSDKGRYMNQFTYSKSFREAGILQKNETFELEVEYIGSQSSTFELAPIHKYAEFQDISPFFLDLGNTFTSDVPFSNDEETQELSYADDSPRYTDSPTYQLEFDEPSELPEFKPYIPDKITIKDEFWKDSKQEDILKHIQDNYKRFMKQDWRAVNYKFIPLQKRHLIKSDWTGRVKPEGGVVEAEGEHILVRVSPTIAIKQGDKNTNSYSETILQTLLVPVEYINEDMFEMPENRDIIDKIELEGMDEYSPSSPRGQIPRGQMMKQKGGGSSYYSEAVVNKLLEELENIIHDCFTIIYETPYYLDSLRRSDIRIEYIDVVDPKGVLYKSGWYFMAPQPVSMGIQHLNPLNPNSIVSKYVVTEKADGIRAQLFIDKNNRGYLITPKKEVIDTGISFDGVQGGWLFDGEYITKNKDKEPIKLFMIFDVYYSKEYKEQPYTFPWISKKGNSRSKIIHKFKSDVEMNNDDTYVDSSIRIGFKQYLEGPEKLTKKKGKNEFTNLMGIFKSNKKIIGLEDKTGGFEYETDGLIFLPMFLPVKGKNENDIVKTIKGTWSLNYKWKPPHENTIDFKVIFYKEKNKDSIHTYNHELDNGTKEIRYCQKVKLAVGYDEKQDETVDFNWSILTNEPHNKQSYQFFDPPTHKISNIHMTNIPLTRKKMICLKDGKEIKNGSIIEMRYDGENKNGLTWTPLRVRDDKVKPQFFTIANNIWQTINEPVTEEMICGTINFDEIGEVVETDKYYVDSKLCEDTPIRDLHNYIKSKLISRICSSSDFKDDLMIADLSCGRGGDIKKYMSSKNKIEFIMGLDISGNINEAAQRYHYLPKPKPKSLFLQFDTSKSVEKGEGCLGNKDECSTLLDIVLGKTKTVHKKYKDIQNEYSGIAKKGFDVVSSQFSLHYYFKDEETLRGFCENVSYLCADDGYFVGTCYDGMKVVKTFSQEDTDTLEMKDDFGSLIYQIKKKYTITDFSYDKNDTENMFGQEIDVFMASIGQSITEYLVNFEFFIDIMKEYGFELALPTFRKGEYNPIKQPIESFDKIIGDTSEIREKDNNFIKKTRNNDLYKVHTNKEYKLLSGLNNWFIFKKV